LLTWMQESETPKYIVATSNDIDDLLVISQGALLRRFDDVFFVDLPTLEERKEIIKIMNRVYGAHVPIKEAENMEGWTGAEIEKYVIAQFYEGPKAKNNIKPIFMQNKSVIERMRKWAKANARLANDVERKPTNNKRKVLNV